jgi:hypothetical protein
MLVIMDQLGGLCAHRPTKPEIDRIESGQRTMVQAYQPISAAVA